MVSIRSPRACQALGRQGPRAGGDDHAPGADALSRHLQQGGFEESCVVLDKAVRGHVVGGVAEHPVDEGVPQVLDVFHDLFAVAGQLPVSVHAVFAQLHPAVIVLRHLDHGLGGHTADPGADGSRLAAVDEYEGFAGTADLADGIETGGA